MSENTKIQETKQKQTNELAARIYALAELENKTKKEIQEKQIFLEAIRKKKQELLQKIDLNKNDA